MPNEPSPALEIVGLRKAFGHTIAVDGLDLTVPGGQVLALLGPNGAGKSTTVDMLLGLAPPDSGSVRVWGRRPVDACRAGLVGAMLQTGGLIGAVTVSELVATMRAFSPHPLPLDEALATARVADIADQRADRLSGGQTQRVRFALAIAGDPDLLVLDEPTVAMDVATRRGFWAAMREWTGRGRTVLFATHYLEEADAYADRVVLMARGRIVADGTAAAIKAQVGGRTIEAGIPGAATPTLGAMKGVSRVEVHGERFRLYCADSDTALRALLAAHPEAHDIEISSAGLEDAFIALTEDDAGGQGAGMNPHLFRLELRRFVRNRRTLIFSVVLPAVFFLTFSAGTAGHIAGLATAPYIMVSMATYGAMNALFVCGGLIAVERAIGWPRQLRIAGLSAREYVTSKVAVAYLTGIPGLVVVFILGSAAKHVHLSAGHWLLAAVSILLGLLPVAVLGVAIGYSARPQTLQALFGIGSATLALLGGMFAPADNFPRALLDICKVLPTYWSADAGRAVLRGTWLGWHGAAVLAVWTVALGTVAATLYRRDSLRPGVSGTT